MFPKNIASHSGKAPLAGDGAGRTFPMRDRAGFSLVELLVTLVVAAVLIALAGVGFPRVLQQARATQCVANLRSLGSAALLFAGENRQRMPIAKDWVPDRTEAYWWTRLNPYLGDPAADPASMGAVFRCPNGEAYRLFGKRMISNKWTATDYTPVLSYPGGHYHYLYSIRPEITPFLVEAENYGGTLGLVNSNVAALANERAKKRHGPNGIHVLYCSGSVKYVPDPDWEKLRPQYTNDANLAK